MLAALPRAGQLSDIEHVVIMIQENRAFDHYFGRYPGVRGFDDRSFGASRFLQKWPGGPQPTLAPFHIDASPSGTGQCIHDQSHDWVTQHQAFDNGAMDTWLTAHITADGATAGPLTMGYVERADIPFYWALADAFTLCDNFFCSAIGPTWPNRMYSMAASIDPDGTHGGPNINTPSGTFADYGSKVGTWTLTTMPERLSAAGVSWKVFNEKDFAITAVNDNVLVFFKAFAGPGANPQFTAAAFADMGAQDSFALACRPEVQGTPAGLPQVSWIITSNDESDHPPFPLAFGENAVATAVNALLGNPALFAKTALFVTWDENGGLFDHVTPPTPPPGTAGEFLTVDDTTLATLGAGAFGRQAPIGLGYRVPTLVISPLARGGFISSDIYDLTSTLRFLESRFGVEVPNLSAWRRGVTGDLTNAFNFIAPDSSIPSLPGMDVLSPGELAACLLGNNFGPLPYPFPTGPTSIPTQIPGVAKRPSGPVRVGPAAPTSAPSVAAPGTTLPNTAVPSASELLTLAAGGGAAVAAWWAARRG